MPFVVASMACACASACVCAVAIRLLPPSIVPYLRMHTNTKHNSNVENMMRFIPRALIRNFLFGSSSVMLSVGSGEAMEDGAAESFAVGAGV